ncbi:hypothetical protein [Priestia aryabhattai]|uniref:hypothetical protein n=1 Tax=Priestia aryabhattai TaxID=412384 RepID=UPI002041C37A|nr:hypothetical protein [Priestia aryabhattai]MCM3255562.1 hypothetical protein [Priestia aryabhattai]
MKLELNLNDIDLKNFLEASTTNGKELMTINVFSLSSPNNFKIDELERETTDKLYKNIINKGKYIYVNFSSNAIDKELVCIDGNTYIYISEEEVEDYFEDEKIPNDFQPYKKLQIYEDSSVGYLLKYNNDKLIVQSAVIQMSYSSIEVLNDVELLDDPMVSYLQRFIK